MRKESRLRRQLGFGSMVEVPAPVYLQAALMRLVDEAANSYEYILPVGEPDRGANYVRCCGVDPTILHYPPKPLKAWNAYEEEKRPILLQDGIQKLTTFLRGRLLHEDVERWLLVFAQQTVSGHNQISLMYRYLTELMTQIEMERNWNLTIEQFAASQPIQNTRVWMLDALNSGRFDLMIEGHARYITRDKGNHVPN